MKSYVDTKILITTSVQDHPQYIQSFELLRRVKDGALQACITTHGLAEFYSALIKAGLVGGVLFDALHLCGAQKAGCDRIYTFNVKDFRALATDAFRDKITAP